MTRAAAAWVFAIGAAFVLALPPAGAAAQLASAAKPPPSVRMLFVGVDHYLHSYPADAKADPSLHDLNGAVNDVRLMKDTLRTLTPAAPLPVDSSSATPCWGNASGPPPPSITLLDGCATRPAIFDALVAQIEASPVNGLVLFYFAGHGSSLPEIGQDQATFADLGAAYDPTILPADAWRETNEPDNDIRGRELNALIEAAAARGVSVVTIFDSCHSGTATRDVDGTARPPNPGSRAATSKGGLVNAPYQPSLPPPGPFTETPNPYRVHLAAAADDQDAQETTVTVVVDGKPKSEIHGLFTVALTETLEAHEAKTYLEVAQGALRRLNGRASHISVTTQNMATARKAAVPEVQTSESEGPLSVPFLGRLSDESRGFVATVIPGSPVLTVEGGSLNLITPRSKFQVFAAAGADQPLATGTVTAVNVGTATMALDAPPAGPGPLSGWDSSKPLWVQETVHDCGGACLRVAIVGGDAADEKTDVRDKAEGLLASLAGESVTLCDAACAGDPAQYTIALGGPEALLRSADGKTRLSAGVICRVGVALQTGGGTCDPDWARRLAQITTAAARYFALTSLARFAKPTPWYSLDIYQVLPDGCPKEACGGQPKVAAAPSAVLRPGPVDLYLTNTSSAPFYRYLLLLGPDDFSVTVLTPPGYSEDPPMERYGELDYAGVLGRAGRAKLLILMTRTPINVASLHQEPVRDLNAVNDLERLLASANQGRRDAPQVGDFDVDLVDLDVRP